MVRFDFVKEWTMIMLRTLALLVLASSAPAFAQVASIESSNPARKSSDPNKMICEVAQTTGTRLGARKVCKTAAEWAQLKEETRQNVEKVQQQATSTGAPSG
jgi:hypothetical protein